MKGEDYKTVTSTVMLMAVPLAKKALFQLMLISFPVD